ncbi:MAG: sigma-70 family RNA polymerase sigma factor [Lentisphaerae bacterium]|nr:sigma-70 family RNA polymerase sigma factor [Lentisphaerota bacterium]
MRVQQLFVAHQTSVKAFVLSLRPDFTEAADILQETFLTVTRKAAEFREGSNFTAWAFAIARFKVLESGRVRRRETDLSDEVLDALAADAPPAPFFDRRLEALRACLRRLAPRAQEIVRLRYHSGHGPEEIARCVSWSANAVNVALSRARTALRDCVRRTAGEVA